MVNKVSQDLSTQLLYAHSKGGVATKLLTLTRGDKPFESVCIRYGYELWLSSASKALPVGRRPTVPPSGGVQEREEQRSVNLYATYYLFSPSNIYVTNNFFELCSLPTTAPAASVGPSLPSVPILASTI